MLENGKTMPSIDTWLREAKADSLAPACGMYLTHNGVVRATPKAEVRGVETDGVAPGHKVSSMPWGLPSRVARMRFCCPPWATAWRYVVRPGTIWA